VPLALEESIEKADAMVRPRHVPQRRHLPATDQPHIRDGVVGGAEGARRDPRRVGARQVGDAVEARGLEGFGGGHRWPDGREPERQSRCARYGWSTPEDAMGNSRLWCRSTRAAMAVSLSPFHATGVTVPVAVCRPPVAMASWTLGTVLLTIAHHRPCRTAGNRPDTRCRRRTICACWRG
jgi:hypothetical protein